MSETKRIRALERGLEVMEALQDRRAASLKDLYEATGLPRPTLIRILHTLETAGVVRRSIGDGLYRATYRLQRLAGSGDESDRLADIAAPVIDSLCRQLTWPSDLAVLEPERRESMILKETSRPTSPIMLNRDRLGYEICMSLSSVGRAYLAFCPEDERRDIIARLKKSADPLNRRIGGGGEFQATLDAVREAGYAVRDPAFGGGQGQLRSAYDDGLEAMAVPLAGESRVHGTVSMVWPRKALTVEAFAAEHLTALRDAAHEIVAAVET